MTDILAGDHEDHHLGNIGGMVGYPPEEYHYRCPRCGVELWANEAIIDFELGFAALEGREVKIPTLGCPGCNQESLEYSGLKSPPEGRIVQYSPLLIRISPALNYFQNLHRTEIPLQQFKSITMTGSISNRQSSLF
jgi:hypothetical protein